MEVEVNQVFKCEICNLVVEVTSVGKNSPSLICCGQEMKQLAPQEELGALEKYKPVLEEGVYDTSIVKVGAEEVANNDEYSIEWIEIINGSYVNRKYLKPTDLPEAHFYLPIKEGLYVRAYCNKNGLWQTKY